MSIIHTKNLIIGFGKAGKTLAAAFDKHGENTILVEGSANMYGGTCINVGCIPSKKLIFEGAYQDFYPAMMAKDKLIGALRQANYDKLAQLPHITIMTATAKFLDNQSVILSTGETIIAERIFINTGTRPNMPDIKGIDGKYIYDSTGLLNLAHHTNKAPKHLVIVGGGFIALEFAFMYQAFGTKVSIIEKSPQFLPKEDDDVREVMLSLLAQRGIELYLDSQVKSFNEINDGVEVITNHHKLNADAVLIALGRVPNTQSLGLENTDIKTNERGYIICDETLKASDNIWAMGDIAGSPQFTYMSLDDYRIVYDNLFGNKKRHKSDRQIFPTSVFTNPPLSRIGMNELTAKQSGKNYQVLTMPANHIVKAKISNQTQGLLKAIVDKDTHEILGMTLFCENSHEIINLFKMAMDCGIKADYFKQQIFTHPTISESFNDLFANLSS